MREGKRIDKQRDLLVVGGYNIKRRAPRPLAGWITQGEYLWRCQSGKGHSFRNILVQSRAVRPWFVEWNRYEKTQEAIPDGMGIVRWGRRKTLAATLLPLCIIDVW